MRQLVSLLLVSLLVVSVTAQGGGASPSPNEARDLLKLDALIAAVRTRNARDYAITTPNGIDEARYVAIGGIEQWITIRGEDRRNPVLLLLHGGPGDATNPWGYAVLRSWSKAFTVVQWDQRGAGRTLGRSGASSASALTIARMTQDGIELSELLRKTLRKDKIILVGHSWGSILGTFMVKARPDLFYAYVGTGQVADEARNYAVAYDELLNPLPNLEIRRLSLHHHSVGSKASTTCKLPLRKELTTVPSPRRMAASRV
jgi:pimeloyl-ACP methyl ester carboxylesterase